MRIGYGFGEAGVGSLVTPGKIGRVGKIAAAVSGPEKLRSGLFLPLQHGDAAVRGRRDRSGEPGSPGADDQYLAHMHLLSRTAAPKRRQILPRLRFQSDAGPISGIFTSPASFMDCRDIRIPSFADGQVRPPWKKTL